jgi:hypothetical protein
VAARAVAAVLSEAGVPMARALAARRPVAGVTAAGRHIERPRVAVGRMPVSLAVEAHGRTAAALERTAGPRPRRGRLSSLTSRHHGLDVASGSPSQAQGRSLALRTLSFHVVRRKMPFSSSKRSSKTTWSTCSKTPTSAAAPCMRSDRPSFPRTFNWRGELEAKGNLVRYF